jgi:hypothetical protein
MPDFLDSILQRELGPEAWDWLAGVAAQLKTPEAKKLFVTAFTAIPRHTGKQALSLTKEEAEEISRLQPGFIISDYTVDRLARVWLLLQFPSEDKSTYLKTIGELFKAAEMNESVALYGALSLLAYPEEWVKQCAEGIRSNIGVVLQAIMCDNPYPSRYLDQDAWNQLVLKAIFTEKPVHRIIGLDDRSNKLLAKTLSDYAHERWAAGRTFDPQLWRLTTRFIDENIFPDLKKVLEEGTLLEKEAAALACYHSQYLPAKVLLDQVPELQSAIAKDAVNWEYIAHSRQISSN